MEQNLGWESLDDFEVASEDGDETESYSYYDSADSLESHSVSDLEIMDAESTSAEEFSSGTVTDATDTNETVQVPELESNIIEVQYATIASQPAAVDSASEIQLCPSGNDTTPSTSAMPCASTSIDTNKSKKRPAESDEEDDGQTCLICMEVWSNSGPHRLASLRCGHLFGQSCITRWLQVSRAHNQKKCPQCNKPATVKEVRVLYARKLIALDTAERDRLKEQLEFVEREKNKLDLELKKSQLAQQLHEKQLTDLRKKLLDAQASQTKTSNGSVSQVTQGGDLGKVHTSLAYSVDINKSGGCRVLAYNSHLEMVVVSQCSANALFSGYGISKMNSVNFSRTQFVFLHTKQIRDLAFHAQDNELLLSVSLDKCAKLLDIASNSVVQSFQTESPLWSCCWDADNNNVFFVGDINGTITQYDIRHTNSSVGLIAPNGISSPITSLAAVPSTAGGALPRGGIIACHLNSCWVHERTDVVYEGVQLPLEGPFVSMRYDSSFEQVLVSSRPSSRSIKARHFVCELSRPDKSINSLTCNTIQTFLGSTTQNQMSRPCQMSLQGQGPLVATFQENTSTVALWSVGNGQKMCNFQVRDPLLDLCPIKVNGNQYLGTLSEKTFHVYKVT